MSEDRAIALASDMPSTTNPWISRHLAEATGDEASLPRMVSARLNGTPAAKRLESNRVKFSNSAPLTLAAPNEKPGMPVF